MQKFNFLVTLQEILENDEMYDKRYLNKFDKQKLNAIIKNQPILQEYQDRIKNGDTGDQYLKPTQDFIYQQHQRMSQNPEQKIHTLLDDVLPRQFSGVNPSANYTFNANEMKGRIIDNERRINNVELEIEQD